MKFALTENEMLDYACERLSELLRQPFNHRQENVEFCGSEIDGLATIGTNTFAFEVKDSGQLSSVSRGIRQLTRVGSSALTPVLVVPFMTAAASERCRQAGVHWLDLSGNASVHLDGVIIEIEGKPNAYPQRGRPASVFAPKSARISRWLLMHPDEFFSQRQLANFTAMDEGFTSRIVSQMEEQQLIERDVSGRIRPLDPGLLLDAWSEEYDFSKHEVVRGHISARSGDQLLTLVSGELADLAYAATGLAGAWVIDGFAGFRLVTIYGGEDVVERLKNKLFFRQEEKGANLWLVQPNDEGVFQGSLSHQNV